MKVLGLVGIGELKNLGINNMDDWHSFQKKNPERILGILATKLLVTRK